MNNFLNTKPSPEGWRILSNAERFQVFLKIKRGELSPEALLRWSIGNGGEWVENTSKTIYNKKIPYAIKIEKD